MYIFITLLHVFITLLHQCHFNSYWWSTLGGQLGFEERCQGCLSTSNGAFFWGAEWHLRPDLNDDCHCHLKNHQASEGWNARSQEMEVVIKGRQVHWLLEFPIQHLLLLLRVFCKELHLTNPDLAQDNRFTDWRNTIDAAFTTLTVKTILLMLFCVRSNNQIFYEVLQRQLYWETQFLFKRHPRAIQTNTFIFNSSEQWKYCTPQHVTNRWIFLKHFWNAV